MMEGFPGEKKIAFDCGSHHPQVINNIISYQQHYKYFFMDAYINKSDVQKLRFLTGKWDDNEII